MNPNDASKLILSTDYGLDKVLETYSGSFSAGAQIAAFQPRLTDQAIDHTAGDWCLIIGAYSLNGSTWFPLGIPDAIVGGPQPIFQSVEVNAYCTVSQVVIQASNFLTSSQTIYYALQLVARD